MPISQRRISMNGVILVRDKDLERIKIVERLMRKEITQREAGKLLNVSDRQVRNIFKRYKNAGNEGVISKKLGKASNRKLPEEIKNEALRLIRQTSRCSSFRKKCLTGALK